MSRHGFPNIKANRKWIGILTQAVMEHQAELDAATKRLQEIEDQEKALAVEKATLQVQSKKLTQQIDIKQMAARTFKDQDPELRGR